MLELLGEILMRNRIVSPQEILTNNKRKHLKDTTLTSYSKITRNEKCQQHVLSGMILQEEHITSLGFLPKCIP